MKKIIIFNVIALLLALPNAASADKVCQKLTLAGKKIKQSISTISSTAVCPKGSTEIINTATLTGATGAPGIPGAPGAQGPQGLQGPAGGFLPTLPPGQLMKGVYGGAINTSAAGEYFVDSQTFPFPLPSDIVAEHYIKFGDPAIAECPGTASAPDALPGHLCLYESSANNRNASGIQIFNPATESFDSTDWRLGFTVFSTSTVADLMVMYGSYAVRAQ